MFLLGYSRDDGTVRIMAGTTTMLSDGSGISDNGLLSAEPVLGYRTSELSEWVYWDVAVRMGPLECSCQNGSTET